MPINWLTLNGGANIVRICRRVVGKCAWIDADRPPSDNVTFDRVVATDAKLAGFFSFMMTSNTLETNSLFQVSHIDHLLMTSHRRH